MAKRKSNDKVKLAEHEYVVTAYAQPAQGPGWYNSPIYVVIANRATGKWREDCIQPKDQTTEMYAIYGFSALAHARMTKLVSP